MQDDFKAPTSPSDNMPSPADPPVQSPAGQTFSPTQLDQGTTAPVPSFTNIDPAQTPSVVNEVLNQANPDFSPVPTQPVASPPVAPVQAPLQPLTVLDPGPIPPATSLHIPQGQAGGPTVGGPVFGGVGGPSGPTFGGKPAPSGKPKKKMLLFSGSAAAVVILGALVYIFAIYLPNTPSNVFSSSLKNSGTALDALITYSKQQEHTSYASTSFTGVVHAKSASASYDVSLSGAYDKNANANMQLNSDIMGEKLDANLVSLKSAGNTSPDIYVQLTGIKSTLDGLGLNKYDYLDGQWIEIDHTLVDTYMSAYQQALGSNPSAAKSGGAPTYAQVEDAVSKVQYVNKQYLFTTDPKKAVLSNQKFIATEKSGSLTLNHYKVGYNKDNLSAYVSAVGLALDQSQLNNWYKGVSGNKNLSEGLKFTQLQSDVKKANSNYTFDLWADKKTKLVSKISFADPSDKSTVYSIGQNYTGGTTFPLVLGVTGKGSSGNPEAANINITLDTRTNKANMTFTSNISSSDGSMTNVSGNASFTPSNSTVQVSAPKSAKSITDILLSLGLSDMANGNINGTTPNADQSTSPGFSLTSFAHKQHP